MPITGDMYAFTDENVDRSPDSPGVYSLWENSTLTYYGSSTVSIRQRLRRHKDGAEGPCTKRATHYQREVTSRPKEREAELVREYERQFGHLPRCNEVRP